MATVAGVAPGTGPLLVGDGIENPHNAVALLDAARMFALRAGFRDRGGRLASAWTIAGNSGGLPLVASEDLAALPSLFAVDNLPGAIDVYSARLPAGRSAVVVGNERRGIGRDLRALASQAVQIPMAPGPLNCLNVAAAAAVALFYLTGNGGHGRLVVRANPERRRPELLLAAPTGHVEAGSALRSAACFGWRRVLLLDDQHVWFGVDRHTTAEGRAAARRARNRIQVIPVKDERATPAFDRAIVVTGQPAGQPLHRVDLAGGNGLLIVIPDEAGAGIDPGLLGRLARSVTIAGVPITRIGMPPLYRLLASIVMAEVARQVGRPSSRPAAAPAHRPRYESALRLTAVAGEAVGLEELVQF
jgi:SpoU rRNA Methylase family